MFEEMIVQNNTQRDVLRRNEAEIISAILSKVKIEEPDSNYPGADVFSFEYGGKKLKLFRRHNEEDIDFSTYISNENSLKRMTNETTLLYLAARMFMQQMSDEEKKVLFYRLLTENKEM
ncbi:MAG: hypothetical protein PHT51_03930 [Patescibacteria group bacterium]|nr:hypothetical protein [Patescibacteria group bacterium]MDD4610415.1 hypothetical protein [Patescibacteria group bacterium]